MWELSEGNAPVEPWKILQGGCRACAAKSIVLWRFVFNLTAQFAV